MSSNSNPSPPSSTPVSVLIPLLAPYIIQVLALIMLGLIVLIHDGPAIDSVINVLLIIAGGNVVAGGGVAAVHLFTRNKGGGTS